MKHNKKYRNELTMNRIWILFLCLMCAAGMSAKNYFVAPAGDDNAPGTKQKPSEIATATYSPPSIVFVLDKAVCIRPNPNDMFQAEVAVLERKFR